MYDDAGAGGYIRVMYCPSCGHRITSDAVFCPECGERTGFDQSEYRKQPEEQREQQKENGTRVGAAGAAYAYHTARSMASGAKNASSPAAPEQSGPTYIQINVTEAQPVSSNCKKWVTFFLCLFLGHFGVHRFYTRKYGTGILFLLFGGFLWLGVIVDLLRILFGGFKDADGRPLS